VILLLMRLMLLVFRRDRRIMMGRKRWDRRVEVCREPIPSERVVRVIGIVVVVIGMVIVRVVQMRCVHA
jgi:hypothetical protein